MAAEDTLIIEVRMPPRQAVFFQSLLQGEDGLAVARCFDSDRLKQQLWTSAAQRDELLDWLHQLPSSVQLEILGEWLWSAGDERTTMQDMKTR